MQLRGGEKKEEEKGRKESYLPRVNGGGPKKEEPAKTFIPLFFLPRLKEKGEKRNKKWIRTKREKKKRRSGTNHYC